MTPEALIKRHEKAKKRKDPWCTPWEDCIDFAQPMRDSFLSFENQGQERMNRVYDETPILACQEFVSVMQEGMIPPDRKFFDFAFVIPQENRQLNGQLKEVSDYVYETMYGAGIDTIGAEVFYDVAIGTASIGVYESFDTTNQSIRFDCMPLQEYCIDQGPFGMPDARMRTHKMTLGHIKQRWPDADIPQPMADKAKQDDSCEFELIEAVYRDWEEPTETWVHQLIEKGGKHELLNKTDAGFGSQPIATGRWSKAGREFYGRGPLFNALPAIRSLNLTYELLFEASEMNIGGVWSYESNGIINPDNINIVPGTLIPTEPGTKGLQGITNPGRSDLSQIILRDQQEKVKRALYNQDLGPTTQTPRSALEVAERTANLNRLIGSSRYRLQHELINQVVNRTVYLLKKQGKIEMPKLDGRELRIVPVSPMARFSKRSEVQAMQEFQGQLQMLFGPQVAMLVNKVPEAVHQLATFSDYPVELLNSVDEIKGKLTQAAEMMAQQASATEGGEQILQ